MNIKKIYRLFLLLVVLNLFLFLALNIYWGGSAQTGKIVNNEYYLGSHGEYTQVSKIIWFISKIQFISVVITVPIYMIIGISTSFINWFNNSDKDS